MDRLINRKSVKGKLFFYLLLFSSGNAIAQSADDEKLLNMCKACHGIDGTSQFVSIPNLKWQNRQYLLEQLKLFQSGQRQDPTMEKVAKLLTVNQMELMATYFNKGSK